MEMSPKEYQAYVKKMSPKSSIVKDTLFAFVIGGAICSLLKSIAEIAVYKIYDFHSLFLNDRITGCTINIAPDMSFVLLFAILFLLSCVFRYGEELQKQSDETL